MIQNETNGSADLTARMTDVQQQAQQQIERVREGLGDLDVQARAFIKEHPGMCLVGAVAVGFMIGRLVSRR